MNNLKIIGNHEEKTLAQARNVLAKGADKFVLCADGHLGYGHPIGGVAAYKDKISISGVGFADEGPAAYKKLDEVLKFHEDSIVVETRLTPIIVCMASNDVRDPYKD